MFDDVSFRESRLILYVFNETRCALIPLIDSDRISRKPEIEVEVDKNLARRSHINPNGRCQLHFKSYSKLEKQLLRSPGRCVDFKHRRTIPLPAYISISNSVFADFNVDFSLENRRMTDHNIECIDSITQLMQQHPAVASLHVCHKSRRFSTG
jgi:hypothetical protein